jgi:hypothetical protein
MSRSVSRSTFTLAHGLVLAFQAFRWHWDSEFCITLFRTLRSAPCIPSPPTSLHWRLVGLPYETPFVCIFFIRFVLIFSSLFSIDILLPLRSLLPWGLTLITFEYISDHFIHTCVFGSAFRIPYVPLKCFGVCTRVYLLTL